MIKVVRKYKLLIVYVNNFGPLCALGADSWCRGHMDSTGGIGGEHRVHS